MFIFHNNNVDKTLLLGLPQKHNGRPIEYITLLSIISPVNAEFGTYEGLHVSMVY